MKVIRCSWFPPHSYKAISLVWWIVVRSDCKFDEIDQNHEEIHGKQQREMLVLPFLLWYGIEYAIRLVLNGMSHRKAYKGISFEQEAYDNESDMKYLGKRKPYSWIKYITKK
jgi:hypothetical protein